MIQRIQSLLLLFSTLLSALLLYLPVYELISVPDNVSVVTRFTIMSSALLVILNGGIGILSFFAIFLYRTRNIQIRMCNLALLLSCVLIGLLFFVADTMSTSMNQKIHYLYGSYIPLIQVLIIFLAIRAIKRDESLIRSADRLR